MELQHLHYRVHYKGGDGWHLIPAKEVLKKIKDNFVNVDQAIQDLDNHKRLETNFAEYEL